MESVFQAHAPLTMLLETNYEIDWYEVACSLNHTLIFDRYVVP